MAIAPLNLPGYATPQSLDFSSLANLGKVYRDTQQEEQIRQARAKLAQDIQSGNTDLKSSALGLVAGGDMQGGLSLANLARADSQDQWNRTYQGGMLDLAKLKAQQDAVPSSVRVLQAAGLDPSSAEGRKALFPKTDTPISATDKKAIFEAEDANLPIQSTVETLNRARELAPKAFAGYTAGVRGTIGTNLPGIAGKVGIDPDGAKATVELNQLLSGEAIKNMAQTLKGATTDSEMNRFTTILADPNAPPDLKVRTINRMQQLAERQMQLNTARIKDLRGGTYFKEGGGGAAPQQQAAPAATGQFRDGQRASNGSGQVIEYRNGQWTPVQ